MRRVALGHGFLDPFVLMARMQRFSQPSEVAEPIELLRAGAAMHSRGLINSRVIQNNLDWVWPYWVSRQVDPTDRSFLPRSFSITQINLTHRNWTAVGVPDCQEMPIVDPRGLVTPFLDGWSVDAWILADDGRRLFPSRAVNAQQKFDVERVAIVTETESGGLRLRSETAAREQDGRVVCHTAYTVESDVDGWLVVALRPYNTEGISFIDSIELTEDRSAWNVDQNQAVISLQPGPDRHHVSHYRRGDVMIRLAQAEAPEETGVECDAGMATAAASYRIRSDAPTVVQVEVPLTEADEAIPVGDWATALAPHARPQIPDERLSFLYDAAIRTLVILSPDDAFPGPATYRRFWFRDAAFMINALLACGLTARARRALERFPERQTMLGYFQSQEGEWDSNGEALWIMHRYGEMTGTPPEAGWRDAILSGARWIRRKRVDRDSGEPHAGLLPPGFSAEHLGPNDYYYWDDFWSEAGLRSAAEMATALGEDKAARDFGEEADDLSGAIARSLATARERLGRDAMPASPYRRLDAGAIGSIVAGFPLQLMKPDDPRLLDTVEFLLNDCFVGGGFFQDIIHSGINAYLTLHIAQVLMRAGDERFFELLQSVADLASPTGQWPEAIHPQVPGGCMGDGQHGWAAAEFVVMMRNAFLREEGDTLVLGGGVTQAWLASGQRVSFGPAPTRFGPVEISVEPRPGGAEVAWQGEWRTPPAAVEIALPGHERVSAVAGDQRVRVEHAAAPRRASAGTHTR